MTSEYRRPVPRPTMNPELTAPFWAGTKRHELWLQNCKPCNRFIFYPREACPECWAHGDDLVWTKASGMGRVHSYTVVYQPAHPAFGEFMPQAQVLIELDEGVRMVGNMVDVTSEEFRADPAVLPVNQRVEAVFEDVTPEWTLIKWRRVDEEPVPGSESEPTENPWANDPRYN